MAALPLIPPAMNFMTGKATGDGTIALDHGGTVRAANARVEAGRSIAVGIRPEHLRPSEASDAYVTGTVEMVEQLGADTLIHIGHGDDAVIARLPHGVHPEIGATLSVTADPTRVFLFDAASGARVR